MEIPEGFANVRHVFSLVGRPKQMGWSHGIQCGVGQTAADVAPILTTAFTESFIPSTGAILAGWTYVGVEVTKTFAGNPDKHTRVINTVGSGGANGLVVNCALLVNKNTGVGGRKNRGRAFVPPFNIPEASVDQAGFLLAGDLVNQAAGYAAYRGKLEAEDLFLFVFHSSPADPATLITSLTVSPQVATQRRRLR